MMAVLRRVAGLTGRHDVVCGVGATLRQRDNVVLFEVASRTAVGARMAEPGKDGRPLISGECGRHSGSKRTATSFTHRFFQATFGRAVAFLDDLLVVPALFFSPLFGGASVGSAVDFAVSFGILGAPLRNVFTGSFRPIVLAVIPLVGSQSIVNLGWQLSPPQHHLLGELYHAKGAR